MAARREAPEAGGYFWGRSTEMARLRRDALALARTSLPMLLLGETGTGKSALAERVIHPATGRKGPFVAVDLSAIPPTLVAAELFGSARGAFSGAVDRAGVLEAAARRHAAARRDRQPAAEVQRMLLLALENGRVTRLGETTPRAVDVKLVAATNADLPALVAAGTLSRRPVRAAQPDGAPDAAAAARADGRSRGAGRDVRRARVRARRRSRAPRRLRARPRGCRRDRASAVAFGRRGPIRRRSRSCFPASSLAAMRAHGWPGNVRELGLVVVERDRVRARRRAGGGAARDGRDRGGAAHDPAGGAGDPAPLGERHARGGGRRGRYEGDAGAARASGAARGWRATSSGSSTSELFRACDGDFAAMAKRLIGVGTAAAARKVRLRFNQLGLRARRTIR